MHVYLDVAGGPTGGQPQSHPVTASSAGSSESKTSSSPVLVREPHVAAAGPAAAEPAVRHRRAELAPPARASLGDPGQRHRAALPVLPDFERAPPTIEEYQPQRQRAVRSGGEREPTPHPAVEPERQHRAGVVWVGKPTGEAAEELGAVPDQAPPPRRRRVELPQESAIIAALPKATSFMPQARRYFIEPAQSAPAWSMAQPWPACAWQMASASAELPATQAACG